jgi:hypothetical protein
VDVNITYLLLTGAETVVDIWLHSGSDSSVLSNEKEIVNTEESTSGGINDVLEQQVPAVKVEGNVKSTASQEVCDTPTKEQLLGLIEPKLEAVDSFDCIASCDDTSQLASGQDGHSSCDMASSSLDHDYFGVVDIKKESGGGCEFVQSLPGCSQEISSEEGTDSCKVKSNVVMDSSVQNHVVKDALVMQENETNSIPFTPELPTQSTTVSNHVVEQNMSVTKNNLKLTTLVKCMDKSGHVFYLTLGKANLKQQIVPKLEQSVKVANLTSLLIKQQTPNPLLHNQLSPTVVTASKPKVKVPVPKPQLNSYNCKVKSSVTSQGNSSVLVSCQEPADGVITNQGSTYSLLSVEANSSSLVTSQGTPTLTPLHGTNLKPGVKVISPVVVANNSSEVMKQLQSSSGQLLALLKVNADVPTAVKLEEGNKAGALKDVNLCSAQTKSNSMQDQSCLIVKNGQLYLLKHQQTSLALSALSAKSSPQKCESILKQQDVLLSDTVWGSKSILTNPVRSTRGGLSLLKKQTNTSVLQNMLPPAVVKIQDVDKSEDARLLLSGRTLVLNKANSRHITHPSKLRYEDALK